MSEDDLVLCERAAKAAGVKVRRAEDALGVWLRVLDDDHGICGADEWFRPLDDDGQVLRMAVVCKLYVFCAGDEAVAAACHVPPNDGVSACQEVSNGQWLKATRRAVVRAVAEMAP